MNIKKSKGFTIIELLVVIAIIAVLASIVLVNVTSYINKGKDSAVKGNLANALVGYAIYADANPSGADTACANTNVLGPYNAANAANGSGEASCADAASTFCVCAQLVTDTTKYFCVDDEGRKTETTVACLGASGDCVEGTDYDCDGT